ncbi:MAG: glycosyltransferase family A protein [Opitutaceae bacterium]
MPVPLLTICMPAYKADRYLEATLDSVRSQTFSDWELILVEDGSHDRAEMLVDAFAKSVRQPVRFLRQEKNQGLPATRNTGIALAASEWIVLLDSDDLWSPTHLADLVACAARNPEVELIHAGSVLFDSDTGRELEIRSPSPAIQAAYPLSLFLGDYIVQPSSVMLRKSLWSRVGGFDPSFRHVEDREMWMRCAQAGARFAYTGTNTCLYRKHATALSAQAGLMAVAAARVFDKAITWPAIPETLRRHRAAAEWTAAGRISLRENPQAAREYFARAWRHRPSPRLLAYRTAAALLGLAK